MIRSLSFRYGRRGFQQGATTLITALAVLILMTILTLASGLVATVEQRTAGNDLRARQAFEAAMTGYEFALAYLAAPADPALPFNGLNRAPPGSNVSPLTLPQAQTLVGGGRYAVEFCDARVDPATGQLLSPLLRPDQPCVAGSPADTRRVVYARGWGADGAALHHVIALVDKAPAFAGAPANPLVSRGVVGINGSGDVTNPEGRLTIWSGQDVTFTNANFKTNILAPTVAPGQIGEVIESSSLRQAGMDVVANDGNLSTKTGAEFFTNFMGYEPSAYATAVNATAGTSLTSFAGAPSQNQIIFVTPPAGASTPYTFGLSGNPEFGVLGDANTPSAPTVIVVDGNLDVSGNVTLNGLLYVRGNITGNGNFTVRGAIIVEGRVDNLTGSVDVVYNSLLLGAARGLGRAAVLPGSWKDWVTPTAAGAPTFY
jgi:hypothetical protein